MMLAVDAPDELFDASVPRPSAFTHDGAALERVDGVPAGAWLAVTLESMDPTTMTGFDLALYVENCQRVTNWANGRMAAAIAEWSTRPDGDLVPQAVAFILREPLQTAEKRVLAACRLKTRMPRTWRKLLSGKLPWAHAQKAAEATAGVADQKLMDRLEESVWSRGLRNSAGEVRRAFRDAWNRLQPEKAQQRAEQAREDGTDVAFFDGDDGMADVVASLPVEDALLVKNTIDAAALSAKRAGDPRRIGVLRGEAMVAMNTHWLACAREVTSSSQPSEKWTSEPIAAPRLIVPGQPSHEVADASQPSEKTTAAPPRRLTMGRRPIEIGIVIGLRTALGHDELPGEIPGRGLIPHSTIRQMLEREQPRLRLYVVDDSPDGNGRLLHYAETSYRPKTQQAAHVQAAYPFSAAPASSVPSVRCDLEHPKGWPNSPTRIEDLVPVDRSWHNRKTQKRIVMTVEDNGRVAWRTPHGISRIVDPHNYWLSWREPAPF